MTDRFSTAEVGIVGGGQLARMLAESALRMGLRPLVYADQAICPARDAAAELVVGRIDDRRALSRFLRRVSAVVFENEFIDCNSLRAACPPKSDGLFFPGLAAIELLQNKLTQKKLLARLKIPTAVFLELPCSPQLGLPGYTAEIRAAAKKLDGAIVLKWSRLGYDGKGVCVVGSSPAAWAHAAQFCLAAAVRGISVYAERKVAFNRELAVIGVRARTGRSVYYPLVISEQANGICRRVFGPAAALGLRPAWQTQAERAAARLARAAGLTGAFGIEFFETDGGLLVNEIAPRVHNSGHYTQNIYPASQFENHWRAALDLPLFDPALDPAAKSRRFAMLNLLGPPNLVLERASPPLPLPIAGSATHLHWYGKNEIRPGRKLGHLNGIADGDRGLRRLLAELDRCERTWVARLRKTPSRPTPSRKKTK